MTIKAIETEYNGYKFRSRLEARWAVFFDAAGIEYEYEPEGFELSDGTKYLPDFYLPWFKCYVEIKPLSINKSDKTAAKNKLVQLFEEHKHCAVMLCCGQPFDNEIKYLINECDEGGGSFDLWVPASFAMGCFGKRWINIFVDYNSSKSEIEFCSGGYTENLNCAIYQDYPDAKLFCEALDWYKVKARQARFEHGETPVIRHG